VVASGAVRSVAAVRLRGVSCCDSDPVVQIQSRSWRRGRRIRTRHVNFSHFPDAVSVVRILCVVNLQGTSKQPLTLSIVSHYMNRREQSNSPASPPNA